MRYRPSQSLVAKSSAYFDIAFFLRFIFLFLGFYFLNILFLGITSPGGKFYSPFLEHNLNYISWLTNSILYSANIIDHVFGIQSHVGNAHNIKTYAGDSVTVWLPCLGLGIMSFWAAFIIADTRKWQKKLCWILAGIIAVWFINCWRIALLVIALDGNWRQYEHVDHHTIFNTAAYIIIFLMIWLYNRKTKQKLFHNTSSNDKGFSPVVY